MGGGFDASEVFKHFMGGFGHMFGDDDDDGIFGNIFGSRNRRNQYEEKGQSVQMRVPITIEDILNSKIDRDVKFDIKARCPKCNGAGGEGIETCPHCHGTGHITESYRSGFGFIQNSHPCQYCGGTGKTIKHKCKECNGTGFVNKEIIVHVFANYPRPGQTIKFPGKGYESSNSKLPNGDLIVELVYGYDTSKYQIAPDNTGNISIFERVEIPYYDCIIGTDNFKHKLANGKEVSIKIPKYTQEGQQIDIGSFNGMKYKIVVHVKMPTYINSKEKELLEKIKKENS